MAITENRARTTPRGDLITACRAIRDSRRPGYIRLLDEPRRQADRAPVLYEFSHTTLRGGYSCDVATAKRWIDYYGSIPAGAERTCFLAIPVARLVQIIDDSEGAPASEEK